MSGSFICPTNRDWTVHTPRPTRTTLARPRTPRLRPLAALSARSGVRRLSNRVWSCWRRKAKTAPTQNASGENRWETHPDIRRTFRCSETSPSTLHVHYPNQMLSIWPMCHNSGGEESKRLSSSWQTCKSNRSPGLLRNHRLCARC